jgi:hypothetical protein
MVKAMAYCSERGQAHPALPGSDWTAGTIEIFTFTVQRSYLPSLPVFAWREETSG